MCVPEAENNVEKKASFLLLSFEPDILQATTLHFSFPHAESKGEQLLQTLMIRLHTIFNFESDLRTLTNKVLLALCSLFPKSKHL